MTKNILSFFPTNQHIKSPHPSQVSVLTAIDKAFQDGYKNVLLEAPVGSGKSAIAIACSRYYGSSHIITPRKSLQDQYLDDFGGGGLVLMKGRAAYPCTYPSEVKTKEYHSLVKKIENGIPIRVSPGSVTCDKGPCKNNAPEYVKCTGMDSSDGSINSPCPYNVAISAAQRSDAVIHNLHSFVFQAYFTNRFEEREILIIDECHEMEGVIRGFAEKTAVIKAQFGPGEIPMDSNKTVGDWCVWLMTFADKYSQVVKMDGSSDRADFLQTISELAVFSDKFGEKFTVGVDQNTISRSTRFTFTPVNIGHLSERFILSFGKKRLLMSGTIYNKSVFCKNNGLVESETCFIRIGSTFPKETRPIVFKEEYNVDTSHRTWDENFSEMIEKISDIMERFEDAKGLVHTPSYAASLVIENALKHTGRILSHNRDNFADTLSSFYNSKEPLVLLSPVCQQGVDFKYDRARFQIILRVPYLNTSDAFIGYQVKNDYPWYNHQALVTFGQQIGRINRAPDDFGVTFLMDERFGKFLAKNKSQLPKWLLEGIIYK